MSITLSNQQQNVLEVLACFKYLTIQQMLILGVSKNYNSLRNYTLSRLMNRKAIKGHDFGWIPQVGRLAKIYYLTPTGAELLAEALRIDSSEIEYPKGGVQFSRDYLHRIHFINFHIYFREWIKETKSELDFFQSYFDKIGSQRAGKVRSTAKTRVQLKGKTFIPDGITRYQEPNQGKSRLVIIEIHNGVHSKRITEQLVQHMEALQEGLFSHKYGHGVANFVLSIHEHESTLKSVKNRLMNRAEFKPFLPLFLFNTQAQTNQNFSKNWTLADGSKTALFG